MGLGLLRKRGAAVAANAQLAVIVRRDAGVFVPTPTFPVPFAMVSRCVPCAWISSLRSGTAVPMPTSPVVLAIVKRFARVLASPPGTSLMWKPVASSDSTSYARLAFDESSRRIACAPPPLMCSCLTASLVTPESPSRSLAARASPDLGLVLLQPHRGALDVGRDTLVERVNLLLQLDLAHGGRLLLLFTARDVLAVGEVRARVGGGGDGLRRRVRVRDAARDDRHLLQVLLDHLRGLLKELLHFLDSCLARGRHDLARGERADRRDDDQRRHDRERLGVRVHPIAVKLVLVFAIPSRAITYAEINRRHEHACRCCRETTSGGIQRL